MNTNDEPILTLRCKDCGSTFDLSDTHQRFFLDRQLQLPKRCDLVSRKAATNQTRSRADGRIVSRRPLTAMSLLEALQENAALEARIDELEDALIHER